MQTDSEFSIAQTVKGKTPVLPFLDIKRAALGKSYELSLVFIGDALSRKLNREHRSKDKVANVLSFPLSKTSGEIFINRRLAGKDAGFFFIHGLLHLKGMAHGSTMERAEVRLRKKFNIHVPSHRSRH